MILSSAIRHLRDCIEPVAGACALREAEETLEWLLGCSRQDLYLSGCRALDGDQARVLDSVASRRLSREPLAYILGRAYFHSRYFDVSPAVLIPRPETEVLVELVLRNEPSGPVRILDIGTGSGAILATVLQHRPGWKGTGSDISRGALRIAARNCPPGTALLQADHVAAIKGRFEVAVTNPPYVTREELRGLDPEVRDHEPREALDGGEDGLRHYRLLADACRACLVPGGRFYCEIGALQKDAVTAIFAAAGWRDVSVTVDLAGRPRVVAAVNP